VAHLYTVSVKESQSRYLARIAERRVVRLPTTEARRAVGAGLRGTLVVSPSGSRR
jgi:hypothetical protein